MKQQEVHIDYPLIGIIFGLFLISLVAVYSGSGQYETADPYFFVKRQIVWYFIGTLTMIAVARFDYELLERFAMPFYMLGVALLLLVHFFGTYRNGSQRWISFGLFEVQPSEFMKVGLILFLAAILKRVGAQRMNLVESIPLTLKLTIITIIPFALVLIQPDLGSALVIAAVLFTLLIVSGISYKMILLMLSLFTAMIGFLVFMHNHFFELFIKVIKPHQLDRIYGWLNPTEFASSFGYQTTQAILGIGSGELRGSGFNQGSQVQSGKIPEAHTDFIFSVIGEEFGFVGSVILITLYFMLIYRLILIAANTSNMFGVYIAAGVAGLIAFQVFQNVAMTIGLMPVTGLSLPLVSYGGSALLTNMIAMGLVLSIQLRTKKYMFGNG